MDESWCVQKDAKVKAVKDAKRALKRLQREARDLKDSVKEAEEDGEEMVEPSRAGSTPLPPAEAREKLKALRSGLRDANAGVRAATIELVEYEQSFLHTSVHE